MKNRILTVLVFLGIISALLPSCNVTNKTMREPNARVEFNKNDFVLSEQVSAQASSIKILGIDWQRLFSAKTGTIESSAPTISIANIPVVGSFVNDITQNYALYELMNNNPGYDVVFYPQFESSIKRPVLGIGLIYKNTTVKATARLGKLK